MVRMVPSAMSRSIERTWLPKLPCVWWFLPCTSAAMAPPTETKRVPGTTKGRKPRGPNVSIRSDSSTPASRRIRPVAGSNDLMRSNPVIVMVLTAPMAASP